MALELDFSKLSQKEQRLKERSMREAQIIVPTTEKGKMRCPSCDSERRITQIKWDFRDSTKKILHLQSIDRNTRCPETRGRLINEYYLMAPCDKNGNPLNLDKKESIAKEQEATLEEILNAPLTDEQLKNQKEVDGIAELTNLKGIGKKTARALRKNGFVTIAIIKEATLDDLVLKAGINRTIAVKIKTHLEDPEEPKEE